MGIGDGGGGGGGEGTGEGGDGSTLYRKNIAPTGANSFLLKLTPFLTALMTRKANR